MNPEENVLLRRSVKSTSVPRKPKEHFGSALNILYTVVNTGEARSIPEKATASAVSLAQIVEALRT